MTNTIDEIFIESNIDKLESNENNSSINDEYKLYISYDSKIRLLFKKTKQYLTLKTT